MNRSRGTSGGRRTAGRLPRQQLRTCSDERLAELTVTGDDAAFDVLFDRHVADALWYAREALGTWKEAEEAVRHSFAAAHAYLAARGDDVEFAPWLRTILGNHCLSMLQARTAEPGAVPDMAEVADLDTWRRRRRGLRDALLPLAPTAGAPLLGGTLAKVAVVAVMAGSLGGVGQVASTLVAHPDRGTPPAAAERGADVAAQTSSGSGASLVPPRLPRGGSGMTARKLDRVPGTAETREGLKAPSDPPVDRPTELPQPAGDDAPPRSAPPAPVGAATLQQAVDSVERTATAGGGLLSAPQGERIDLSAIGDDLGVPAVKPPVDVRALLLQGTDALPK